MKRKVILLLTHDVGLEEQAIEAVLESGAVLVVARTVSEALEFVCRSGFELDLAVIDFDNGCRGMTLLSAVSTLRPDLPIVAVTSIDTAQVTARAFAHGAAACLAKPVNATELEIVIRAFGQPRLQLVAAA